MELHTQNLVKIYSRRRVVNEVSLQINSGQVVGLLGPNGAGKTTTFYMIVGAVKPNQGKILSDARDITHMPMYKRARLGIGYLAQEPSIFRKLSVEDNLYLILEGMPLTKKEQKKRCDELLEEFKVSHLRKQPSFTLSGGERRRVEIARALCTEPRLLLLDEPFTGIDPISISEIQDVIKYLKEKGIGILVTDHNVRDTLSVVDMAYILHDGKVLVYGTSTEVAENEIARRFYLGEKFTLS